MHSDIKSNLDSYEQQRLRGEQSSTGFKFRSDGSHRESIVAGITNSVRTNGTPSFNSLELTTLNTKTFLYSDCDDKANVASVICVTEEG